MTATQTVAAPTVPSIELVTVTPELARFWLTQNDSNRNLRRSVWKAYARDMEAGNWLLTAETIKLSDSGRVLDGQHRLTAVAESDQTVQMFVATNVPDAAQAAMDSGSKRSSADALALRGDSNVTTVAATARIALGVAYSPENVGKYAATHAEVLAWVDDHPEVFDAASFINNIASRIKGCRPSMACYTLLTLGHIDQDKAYAFWAAVADQIADYSGDPVVALARRFNEAWRERERLSHSAELSMIYRAWNYRRGNKQMRVVRVNSPGANGGLIPAPEPK